MVSKLPLFLLSIWMFSITPSHEFPDTRANGEDGLDKTIEQLLGDLSAAKRARGLEMDKAENPGRNIPENENRVETVLNVGDSTITRVDLTENGQIVEQRYQDCAEKNEVIVLKPGTLSENCLIHYMDNTQYAYDCEKKGEKVEHTYQVMEKIKDKAFLKEALGSPVCQDAPLYLMENKGQDKGTNILGNVPTRDLKLQRRGCVTYCCQVGWWGGCNNFCATCS